MTMMTNDDSPTRRSVFEGWVPDGGNLAGPLTWFGAAVGMPVPANEDLSAEWLAWVLDQLVTEGDCILILYYGEDEYGYVQFLVHDDHLHAETMSNQYSNPDRPLNDAEILHLLDLGWLPPFGTPEECDLDNSPNFNLRWDVPIPLGRVAVLALRTLQDIYGEIRPGAMTVKFFRRDPEPESACG